MAFKNGDDYVTIDILIKAVFNNSELKLFLNKLGFSNESLKMLVRVFVKIRKYIINTEINFQTLEKYTTTFVKLALEGKLINYSIRDEEIRRTIQVLSKKN